MGHRCESALVGATRVRGGGERALDVHRLLVGDDLDPAFDLCNISISLELYLVGALTSGILAEL